MYYGYARVSSKDPFADGGITVEKRNATVLALNETYVYDGKEVDVSKFYKVEGVVNDDDLNVKIGVEGGKTPREIGTYTLVPTASNANYNITTVNGSLIISASDVPQETKVAVTDAGNGTVMGATQEVTLKIKIK